MGWEFFDTLVDDLRAALTETDAGYGVMELELVPLPE